MVIDLVIKDSKYQPRFHVGSYTSDFQPSLKSVVASCRVSTKTFHVYQTLMKTFRLVACFLHEIPTGLHLLPDYKSLKESETVTIFRRNLKHFFFAIILTFRQRYDFIYLFFHYLRLYNYCEFQLLAVSALRILNALSNALILLLFFFYLNKLFFFYNSFNCKVNLYLAITTQNAMTEHLCKSSLHGTPYAQ